MGTVAFNKIDANWSFEVVIFFIFKDSHEKT